jgi:hypothetical protein
MLAKGSNGEGTTQTGCTDCATTARGSSFDELAKGLASGTISRGRVLKMLGAALVGAMLASGRGAALADNQCKPHLKKCNNNAQCCSGNCIENPQGSGKVCGCAAGQTLCPGNNSCVENCPPGEALDPTTCRCIQCQNASECPTPDNECQRATCTNGVCGVENVPDGTSCDDLNPCTTNDVCAAGVCAGTLTEGCVRCQGDSDCAGVPVDQCHRAVCGTGGFCVVEDRPDGTTCDDGNPCTEGDVCTAGVCAGTQIGDCVRCQNDIDCSGIDVDQCHEAVCTQAGVCVIQNKADGTPCNDAHACTENDVCTAGVCAGTLREGCMECQGDSDCASVPVDQCHSAVCGAEGFCVVENRPDNTACDDNNACTENDVCTAGVCAGTPVAGCVPCQTTTDCPGGQQCQDGRCVVGDPCANITCPPGTTCCSSPLGDPFCGPTFTCAQMPPGFCPPGFTCCEPASCGAPPRCVPTGQPCF